MGNGRAEIQAQAGLRLPRLLLATADAASLCTSDVRLSGAPGACFRNHSYSGKEYTPPNRHPLQERDPCSSPNNLSPLPFIPDQEVGPHPARLTVTLLLSVLRCPREGGCSLLQRKDHLFSSDLSPQLVGHLVSP